MDKVDAFIIGAGPSGTSCALALAKSGWKVVLIDKSSFPRSKVCGGFVGPQNQELLTSLGVWQELLDKGAQIITRSVLYAQDGISVTLPMGNRQALGVSRRLLDDLLVQRVKESGVTLLEGAQVKQMVHHPNSSQITVDHYRRDAKFQFQARHLIDASGHPCVDIKSRHIQLGISALFENIPWSRGQVSLFCSAKGHIGINPFEDHMTNICYVVESSLFAQRKNNPQNVFDGWLKDNPTLRKMLDGVKRVTPWKAVYIPARDTIKLWDKNIWRVGDSAGYINPVTGGGMSVALLSGQLLAHALTTENNQADQLTVYRENYEKCFSGPRLLANLWGALAHEPWSAGMVIKILNSHRYFKSMPLRYSHPPVNLGGLYKTTGGL